MNQMSDRDFIYVVLDIYASADVHDFLWWRTDAQYAPVTFFAMCSDFFDWGTADCEPITKENLHVLLDSFKDLRRIEHSNIYLSELFAARIRRRRPMTEVKFKDEKLKALFDACGPER
jgi:hypothetical protein